MDELNQFDDSLLDNNQEEEEVNNEWTLLTDTQEPTENEENEEETTEEEEESNEESLKDFSDNGLYTFLQSKGISDPSSIKFLDENEDEIEVDFNSLSPEEQASILAEITDPGISDYEYQVINYLRQNNTTLEKVIDHFAEQRLQDYLKENPDKVHTVSYSVDDYTDDELYLADLKSKYKTFSDEELLSMLNSAKENDELFTKTVEVLRSTYKEQEDQEREAALQLESQQAEDLRTNLINASGNFNEIALDYTDPESDSLVIEDEDKKLMLSYLLDQDKDGKSQFVKDIENPDTLIELAWLRTKGADTLSEITQYYKNLLAQERKETKKLQNQIEKSNKEPRSTVIKESNTENFKKSAWDSML